MPSVSSSALALLKEIVAGKNVYQTVSADEAQILHVPNAENLSCQRADSIKTALEELERAGLILILPKSRAGFYSIDRITGSGHDMLKSMSGQ